MEEEVGAKTFPSKVEDKAGTGNNFVGLTNNLLSSDSSSLDLLSMPVRRVPRRTVCLKGN